MRRRLVRRTGLQRDAELAHRRRRVLRGQRDPAERAVRGGVEGIERDDAVEGERGYARLLRLLRNRGELASRLDVRVIGGDDRFVLTTRARLVAQPLGERRHDHVRTLGPDRRGDERRRAFERRVGRGVSG